MARIAREAVKQVAMMIRSTRARILADSLGLPSVLYAMRFDFISSQL
jgi:hypothetical protein